ncbi:hypothetical protein JW868_00540 [Candidatus Woesearchaeota archaeon]|nr:hypothetical protein [Candidatus Woesearchaeota archaeon]
MADTIRYQKVIEKDTSVKRIGILREPTATVFGKADMTFRPVASAFDIGTMEFEVPLDNTTVSLMAAFNFELLKQIHGIDSHYYGLVSPEGELLSARQAISRGIAPNTMRVLFVNRIKPQHTEGQGWDYSMFPHPEINNYVHPMEFIARYSLPQASSVWERIAGGEISLENLGLPAHLKPGNQIPDGSKPILEYSTKFEPDDRFVTPAEAQALLGMTDERFTALNARTRTVNNAMTDYAATQGFERLDGKIEYITIVQSGATVDLLGDAVCTWHEDRLRAYGLGISKQRLRDELVRLNPKWYADLKRAKAEARESGVEDFRTLMQQVVPPQMPSREFLLAMNTLFQAGTNQWVGAKVYDLYPNKTETTKDNLERAVNEFNHVRAA